MANMYLHAVETETVSKGVPSWNSSSGNGSATAHNRKLWMISVLGSPAPKLLGFFRKAQIAISARCRMRGLLMTGAGGLLGPCQRYKHWPDGCQDQRAGDELQCSYVLSMEEPRLPQGGYHMRSEGWVHTDVKFAL